MPIKSLAKNYSAKNFTVGLQTTSKMTSDGSIIFSPIILKIMFIVLQVSDEISVQLMAALSFK